jgi:hypothetical protein
MRLAKIRKALWQSASWRKWRRIISGISESVSGAVSKK